MKKTIIILLFLFTYSLANEFYQITPSNLNLKEHALRESDFSKWEANIVSQETFDEMTEKGYFPIISQTREYSETRRIYKKLHKGYFVSRSGANQRHFFNYHERYINEGYILLTLSAYTTNTGSKRYSATWVSNGALNEALGYLEYYGISQAKIY